MKRTLTIAIFLLGVFRAEAQTGTSINTNGAAPDPSAILDVSSTDQGILIPRMTEAQKTALPSPANGLMIFQSDGATGFWYYNGSSWSMIGDNLGNHTASDSLDMSNLKITNLALCTNNLDAANKEYVDNAVGASGGSGAISKPEQISNETPTAMVYASAMQYCENLTEEGYNDWRLPEAGEIQYFAGMSGATTNFLWTKTLTDPQDFATNQNFITVRLTDGKWKFGGVARFYFPTRSISGVTNSTSWTSVLTFGPLNAGNLFVPTSLVYNISSYSSGNSAKFRLKYTFPDGSFYYSSEVTLNYDYQTPINSTTIPILNEGAAYSKIEAEIQSLTGANNKSASLAISGYEISLTQKDGATLYSRCVR